jgi:hypothetical protein
MVWGLHGHEAAHRLAARAVSSHLCSGPCHMGAWRCGHGKLTSTYAHCAGEPLHSYGAAEPAGRGRSSDGYAGGEAAAGFSGRSGPGLQYRPNAGSAAADAGGEYAAGRPGLQASQPKPQAGSAAAADQPGLDPSWESWEQQQEEAQPPGEQQAGQGYTAGGGQPAA